MDLLTTLIGNTPSDQVSLEGAIISGVCVIIAALLGLIAGQGVMQRHHAKKSRAAAEIAAENTEKVKEETVLIREQVQNTHETNLRDDLDDLTNLIQEMSKKQDRQYEQSQRDIGGLRQELRQVREDQTEDRKTTHSALAGLAKLIRRHDE